MAKAGWKCAISKSGPPTAVTFEPMTNISGNVYQITSTARRMVDISAWHLKDSLGCVPYASITAADLAFGEFTVAGVTGTTSLTFHGKFLPLTGSTELFREAKSFTITDSDTMLETTVFTSTQNFKKRIAGLNDYQLSVDLLLNSTDMNRIATLRFNESICGIQINSGASAVFRGYGLIENVERGGSVDGLVEAKLTWAISAVRDANTGLFYGPSDRLIQS